MPSQYEVRIFGASNLTNGSGAQAFTSGATNGSTRTGTFTTGSDTGQIVTIVDDFNTTGPNQGGDSLTTFDDGTGARQALGEPVTLTYDQNGTTVTKTFPPGSQVQAEFVTEFSDGTEIVAIRIQNPDAGQPGQPNLVTAGYAVVGGAPPPGTTLGTITGNTGNGTTPYSDLPCFTPDVLIDTPSGPRPVGLLRPGDMVLTRDDGACEVTWTGARDVSLAEMAAEPSLCPIRLASGPVLSPLHRVLQIGGAIPLLTGEGEALIEARWLGRAFRPAGGVRYVHFACARHQIVRAAGLWAETLLRPVGRDPLMAEAKGAARHPARPLLTGYESRVLAQAAFA
ncbi:YD repeat-containing protein [Hasllibacter halocynthiae]|uniref:YD repeat-containing protein n=1 Tax=Hasllibacter halocynthiae TaxID=595589 RepID=A0A2T0X6L9_9RHOB|nr:Hint domain-containing protein [Hasllibacter halocynthiae]PRY94514.1 YD repeat-containing protein [Hasllibacter halocynthiae]